MEGPDGKGGTAVAAPWESNPWKSRDKVDAYIWVKSATAKQIKDLRDLIPPEFLQGGSHTPPAGKSAYIRHVFVLAGPYDALICATANTTKALDKLVLQTIHKIIQTTETSISLWPKGGGTTGNPVLSPKWSPVGSAAIYSLTVQAGKMGDVYTAIENQLQTVIGLAVLATGPYQMLLELGPTGNQGFQDVLNDIQILYSIPGITGWNGHWALTGTPINPT